jgi:ankyrin repeat protein
MTALTFAIAFGHEVTTGYLLEQGADPNLVLTEEGDTPLSFAVRFPELAQRDDLVRLVVEHGGDVTQAAGNGRSPFSELAGSGRAELVRWLMVEQGVGTGDSLPVPPLLRAAEEGEVAVVRLLLQHGADANAIDATGQSALFVAEVQGAGEISELLRSHGADDSGLRRATSPDGLLVPWAEAGSCATQDPATGIQIREELYAFVLHLASLRLPVVKPPGISCQQPPGISTFGQAPAGAGSSQPKEPA